MYGHAHICTQLSHHNVAHIILKFIEGTSTARGAKVEGARLA